MEEIEYDEAIDIYNLNVADTGVLVHNNCFLDYIKTTVLHMGTATHILKEHNLNKSKIQLNRFWRI